MSTHHIRNMRPEEAVDAINLAMAEGWNPGLSDASLFYNTDPNGFFVMEVNGVMAGCISAVRYSSSFGFLGLYIMKPEFRSKGLGIQLWNKALQHLNGCNVGLDGVVAQQGNYTRSGFRFAYNNIRYQYTSRGTEEMSADVAPLATMDFDDVLHYDSQLFPASRASFLQPWINQSRGTGYGIKKNGILSGYIIIRPCQYGYKVGPLYASDIVIARKLFQSAMSHIEMNVSVFIDVPQPNLGGIALAEDYGMVKVFETARMYNKAKPDIDLNQVFGVTTFELG